MIYRKKVTLLKKLLTMSMCLFVGFGVGVTAQADLIAPGDFFAIDINVGPSPTAPGFTGLDATSSEGASVNEGGITATTLSTDGSRDRLPVLSGDLTRDFIFDDGGNQAVLLELSGLTLLSNGLSWMIEVWSYDDNPIAAPAGQQIGLSLINTGFGGAPNETILTDSFAPHPTDPFVTTFNPNFLLANSTRFAIFSRESPIDGNNRSRLNAVRISVIPEPDSAALIFLGGLVGLLFRRGGYP
ncbi:MAG: hypothetical protein AAF492_14815 [Verrucomicrobiota bacterium]